ncbi:unnamed protein product [Hydatigera taeniaeformis]|uniref:DUF4455 domain-containing protein n=1 Tax=Hydatigena taeniaeformis TaxID=6205 RepID=A0A0R3WYZ4_HYDTA|nr:unnamed protein product [Hydatigera taeniaeformis]
MCHFSPSPIPFLKLTQVLDFEPYAVLLMSLFSEYFKLQSQYLESRLKELLKAAEVLSQEDKKIVLKVQKLWLDSKRNLSWEVEQFNQLATLLKDAEAAFSKYEVIISEQCLNFSILMGSFK